MERESIRITILAKFPILCFKLLAFLVDVEFTHSKTLGTWVRRESMWFNPFVAVHNYGDSHAVTN